MKRREFLIAGAALAAFPVTAHATNMNFKPGLVEDLLADGKTVFLDFAAHWCTTCKAQERRIGAIKANNPAYDANIVFVRVDWDQYGRHPFTKSLNIPRRSTLVVLKGDQELGRIVANSRESVIKDLMDVALNAAIS